jgi:adenosyl cobinamide kinase/adenosyl cobinamide phosphate guanylyltransferase
LTLTLLLGGARSGKSALAMRMAASGPPATTVIGTTVIGTTVIGTTVIATAEALDDEMAERIASHRWDRPSSWATIEEPLDLRTALGSIPANGTVVVDCLTLWVANLVGAGRSDADVTAQAGTVAAGAGERVGRVIVVSNEVGAGIVPGDALSRRYRDLLGQVNAVFADHATDAFLVVAGRVLPLMPAGPYLAGGPVATPASLEVTGK